MDHVDFSPDGRRLSAITFRDGAPRLALFDIDSAREEVLPVAVNPAFGAPCDWTQANALLCRIVGDERAAPPLPFPSPNVMEHRGGEAPTRTFGNLLENAYEEVLFEHYFDATLARVWVDGRVRRFDATNGLLVRARPLKRPRRREPVRNGVIRGRRWRLSRLRPSARSIRRR